MEFAGDVRRKFAHCVMVNGMDRKSVRKMKKQTNYLSMRNKLDGNDVIVVGLW